MGAGDFLVDTNWDIQTVDLNVDWTKNSPCFKLTGKKAEAQQGEYNETPLDADGITVYYDATLSKLSYEDNKKGIPNPDSTVYYYATNDTGTKSTIGIMTKADPKIGGHDYNDVYKVTLPKGYMKIRFAANQVSDENAASNGEATALLDIPSKLKNPCYYGDSSDNVIYDGGNRDGYWGEAYTVRDVVYCDEVGTQPEAAVDAAEEADSSQQEIITTSEQNRTEALEEDQRLIERDTLWRKAGYAGIGLIGVLIIFGFIPRKKH